MRKEYDEVTQNKDRLEGERIGRVYTPVRLNNDKHQCIISGLYPRRKQKVNICIT